MDTAVLVLAHICTQFEMNEVAASSEASTVSIGVTYTLGGEDVTWEQLQWEADKAMYTAKRSGRNRTIRYTSERNQDAALV